MMGVKAGLGFYLQWAQGWAAYANMYAALLVMSLMCSGFITLLFKLRDRVLSYQKADVSGSARSLTSVGAGRRSLDIDGVSHVSSSTARPCPCLRTSQLRVDPGEFVALLGPSRLRQVDPAAARGGAGEADLRARSARTAARVKGRTRPAWWCSRTRRCIRGATSGTMSRLGSKRRAS